MTNDEYFNDKPMKEAIAKWRSDCENGYCGDVQDWLSDEFMDLEKGKIVRGSYYSNEEIEEKIRKMESVMVTGYLLEWKNEKGEWFSSEFDPEKGTDTNFWLNKAMEAACDDWFANDVQVGFFKALPDVWFSSSCDWDYRLGAQFNAEVTPKNEPKDNGIWEGLTSSANGGCGSNGEPWRVRKMTFGGALSDNAKEFIRRNPDVVFDYAE